MSNRAMQPKNLGQHTTNNKREKNSKKTMIVPSLPCFTSNALPKDNEFDVNHGREGVVSGFREEKKVSAKKN